MADCYEEVKKLREDMEEIKTTLMAIALLLKEQGVAKSKKPVKKKAEIEEVSNVVYFPESRELEDKFREFMEYRRTEKHNSMGLQSIERTVNALKKFTVKESITALDEAMRNGYTGVFPKHIPDENKRQHGNPNQTVAEAWGNA